MGKGYLSYTMALFLQVVDHGYRYGFDIMTITGLASGTVYPALRRLEDAGLVVSKWERPSIAQAQRSASASSSPYVQRRRCSGSGWPPISAGWSGTACAAARRMPPTVVSSTG